MLISGFRKRQLEEKCLGEQYDIKQVITRAITREITKAYVKALKVQVRRLNLRRGYRR